MREIFSLDHLADSDRRPTHTDESHMIACLLIECRQAPSLWTRVLTAECSIPVTTIGGVAEEGARRFVDELLVASCRKFCGERVAS